MRELGLAGLIAVVFGLGSFYATGKLGAFSQINLALGALTLVAAAVGAARKVRGFGTPAAHRMLGRRVAVVLGLLAAAGAAERLADRFAPRFDWTLEDRYVLSPATLEILGRLPDDLIATVYYDPGDPRIRGTRLLLEAFERTGELTMRARAMGDAADELERLGLRASNSVVLELGERFEVVERPTEGTLWEGLLRLADRDRGHVVYVTRGEGEGDLGRADAVGYSGLGAALQAEGYVVRDLVLAAAREVPDDASAVLVVAPRRGISDSGEEALRCYLARGGRLIVLLDPGADGGLHGLLAEYGLGLPNAVVVDPASGPIQGAPPGVGLIAHSYSGHPVVRTLDGNRMTFFPRVRPVVPERKPQPEDRLEAVVYSSPRAWLATNIGPIDRGFAPERGDGADEQRYPLVVVGRYPRPAGEARLVVFGDSDLASNQHLRALYNLDLVMNAVHWAVEREPAITRRPKFLTPDQRPLLPVETLAMFYGVGLLVPELLLIAAAVVWVRRRTA